MLKNLPDPFTIPKPFNNLFFFRRRPKLRVNRDWPPPELKALEIESPQTQTEIEAKRQAEERYKVVLMNEGFASEALFKQTDPISDALTTDLRELNQHLLPHFWRRDQEAKHYQNLHYLYQWTFILGAFLTTILAALSILLYQLEAARFWLSGLGIITTLIGGITGSVSFLESNQSPQQHWFQARAKAEALRSLYFLFLARQKPFDIADEQDRVQHLRRMVLRVQRPRRLSDDDH